MPLLRSIGVRQPIPNLVVRDTANNKAEESDCLVREKRDGGTELDVFAGLDDRPAAFPFWVAAAVPRSTDQEPLLG